MQTKYVASEYKLAAFSCPYCNAYSAQEWLTSSYIRGRSHSYVGNKESIKDIAISTCHMCGESSVWIEDLKSMEPIPQGSKSNRNSVTQSEILKEPTKAKIIYPISSPAPMPTADMPQEIIVDYLEAREIVNVSPRGAAALLRLCVQKLLPILGEKEIDINDGIASLVKKGLPVEIQQALDSLRVIGNEAVHPGTISLNDNREIALALFGLLNFIIERMITQPNQIRTIYTTLPKSKLDGIVNRDKKP